MTICSVFGCPSTSVSKGWCRPHYDFARRRGQPQLPRLRSERGSPARWIKEHAGDPYSDECLIWPFARTPDGRAHMRQNNKTVKPSRLMCETAHGLAPTPKHQAAHSCGKGHKGCVHPRHLRWATKTENEADRVGHGTARIRLAETDVLEIRRIGKSQPLAKTAARFDVNISCISKIINRVHWKHLP